MVAEVDQGQFMAAEVERGQFIAAEADDDGGSQGG